MADNSGERFASPACSMHEFEAELLPIPRDRIRVRRVYAQPADADGVRVLVDRLWPRGLSKGKAALDEWFPDVAPSTALRKWFGHDARRFREFGRRYRAELEANEAALEPLRQIVRAARTTLLYAARDERCNHALVLADFLRRDLDDHAGTDRRTR